MNTLIVILSIIGGGIIPIMGVLYAIFKFIPDRRKEWIAEMTDYYGGFVRVAKFAPRKGGTVYAGVIMGIESGKDQYLKGQFYFSESELDRDGFLTGFCCGTNRLNLVMDSWLRVIFSRTKLSGTLYIVAIGSAGFESFKNEDQKVAKYRFEYDRISEEITVIQDKVFMTTAFVLPEYFVVKKRSEDFADRYKSVKDFAFTVDARMTFNFPV